jgi:hypothetical protein
MYWRKDEVYEECWIWGWSGVAGGKGRKLSWGELERRGQENMLVLPWLSEQISFMQGGPCTSLFCVGGDKLGTDHRHCLLIGTDRVASSGNACDWVG